MLSQSRSLEFLIVQSISFSKRYSTFWAWLDHNKNIVARVNLSENSQVFNSEFSVLSIVQNGKLGVGKPLTLIIMHKRKTPRFSTPPSFPV